MKKIYELFSKRLQIIRSVGIANFISGVFSRYENIKLKKKYSFDAWHISPMKLRPYALWIVQEANRLIASDNLSTVVEIGCGLGEIIGSIKTPNRYGLDISDRVIEGAKEKRKNTNIEFSAGSFDCINNMCIDVLIAVNFTHGILPETLKKMFDGVLNNNTIKYVVVDTVETYKYPHDFSKIFTNSTCIKKSPVFTPSRTVLIYKM